jgi:hypothetical protein
MNDSTPTRKAGRSRLVLMTLASIVALPMLQSVAMADDAHDMAQQQMEAIRKQMESAGMSAEEIRKIEAQYQDAIGPVVEQQAAKDANEQAAFEARNAGLGKAVVSVAGKYVEMQVTKCEPDDGGNFIIEAQADRNRRNGTLNIRNDKHYERTTIMIMGKGIGDYEKWVTPIVAVEDKKFSWIGMAQGPLGPTELTVTVNCEAGQ